MHVRPLPRRLLVCVNLWVLVLRPAAAPGQGVTSGAITGTVCDVQGEAVPGASVVAVHEPSGSRYEAVSRADGRFTLPGLRVGGPYTVTATLAAFPPVQAQDVIVSLGVSTDLQLRTGTVTLTEEVTVTAQSSEVFSSARTGAATTVTREALASLPTLRERIDEFARLTPQHNGGPPLAGAFAGADARLNDITVDGASFNNAFGLGAQPGDRTGVAPIAIEAIEEVQVNLAPYDVQQGNFVGAGVNSVTRSGDNRFRGSAYYRLRDDGLVGHEVAGQLFDPGRFGFGKWGGWVSGPVVRDRLSFFLSFEDEQTTLPGTTFRANTGGETVGGSTTRVLAADLDSLSRYLRDSFGYDTGPYQGYDRETPARRYLAKLNYNLSDRQKLSLRYHQLDSFTDLPVSNSAQLGFGGRQGNTTALAFESSNYQIREDIRSVVGEWTSVLGANRANTLIVGATFQDESRDSRGTLFPLVDVLEQGSVYTTFGYEPFTPKNALRQHTFQAQDNLTWHRGGHALTFGASVERYRSENVFFPGSQGVYVYNSLADFYRDADGFLANPDRAVSPVTLRRFQVRWANLPGMDRPLQPLAVWYTGAFAQDEWQARPRLRLTYGLRVDLPFFGDTGYRNAEADGLTFRDASGNPVRYQTARLPDANVLWSPRVGFNWALDGRRDTQLRGGSGVFTGRPAYVWISNQVGNTGVLTGFEQLDNTRLRPFNPSPDAYRPAVVTGDPAPSYELALTDPGFRFPQVWRSSLAVDRRLPWGIVGTLEGLYTRDVSGPSYVNVNLPAAQSRFAGADDRPRWTANRIHPNVTSAVVLDNEAVGHAWNVAASISRSSRAGFLRAAYAYTRSQSTVEAGSIASTSWGANPHSGDPNHPGLGYSAQGHRAFVAGSYRLSHRRLGATTLSFFLEGRNAGNASYTYAGDLNGDSGIGNDLVYVPRDESEMNFTPFAITTPNGPRAFTAAEQAAAWNAYIAQDQYLRQRRGRYAERNGLLLPMVWRLDVSVAQDLVKVLGGRRHSLQLRADLVNATNLLNSGWGVARRPVNAQPLTNAGVDAQGRATYRLRVVNDELMARSLEPSASLFDVYRIQLGVKYSFD
jgi:hypothetical protein